jgi:hypothetical protein
MLEGGGWTGGISVVKERGERGKLGRGGDEVLRGLLWKWRGRYWGKRETTAARRGAGAGRVEKIHGT